MKKLFVLTLAVVLSFGLAVTSEAALGDFGIELVAPESGQVTTGDTNPGLVELDSVGGSWNTPGNILSGEYTAWVYEDADGFLVFAYQISVDENEQSAVKRVTAINFGGFETWADSEMASGLLQDALMVDRDNIFTIGFDFRNNLDEPQLNPGETSEVLWVHTNATNYTSGFLSIQNGGSVNVAAFAPAAVPEPTSMVLFGTGLLGFAARRKKRFKA